MTDAYIYDAIRTPRGKGKPTGALYEVRAIDLLSDVLKELQCRNDIDTSQVDDGIFGCVTAMDDQGGNIGKASLLFADWHESVGGMQINRFCCSGLEAVNLAAMKIRSGLEDLIVAGGVESMSRVPMHSDDGPMLFDPDVVGKINYLPQGVAADLIATIERFSREELDEYALQSHQRATLAELIENQLLLELLAKPVMNVVCFRFNPKGLSDETLNALNKEILMRLHEQGIAAPSYGLLNGRYAIRVANVNHRSRKEDFEALVNGVLAIGKMLVE